MLDLKNIQDYAIKTDKIFYKNLGINLKRIRKFQGYSQNKLAQELGIKLQQYQRYESGANKISIRYLLMLTKILDTSLTDIINDRDITNTNNKATKNIVMAVNELKEIQRYQDTIIKKQKNIITTLQQKIIFLESKLQK